LNKFDVDGSGETKTLTLRPIDVTGKQNLKLTIACAGTFRDFETSDFLDVMIDPQNTGAFTQLIHFTAPSGTDKFFDDRTTNPANPTHLGLVFQDVTYDIPPGATQLRVQIQALTSWFNEIVGFDNIRITEATAGVLTLESAASVTGPYAAATGAVVDMSAKTITVPVPSGTQFYRGAGLPVRFTSISVQGNNLVIRYE
jgi:hypothetical protein